MSKGFFRPFRVLERKVPREELPAERPLREDGAPGEWLRGVKPLRERQKFFWRAPSAAGAPPPPREEEIPVEELLRVRVKDTPEYVEELVRGFERALFEALHRGRIAVSRVLNLHRFRVQEAEEAFCVFMREALARGDRCVLIVHGRGLSSKGEPVLKRKVHEWLRQGPFRRHVIGFCSARQCDGGAGATYVLLSPRPIRKTKVPRGVKPAPKG